MRKGGEGHEDDWGDWSRFRCRGLSLAAAHHVSTQPDALQRRGLSSGRRPHEAWRCLSAQSASWWTAVPALRDCQAQPTPISISSRSDGPILSPRCLVPGSPVFALGSESRSGFGSAVMVVRALSSMHGSRAREGIGRSLVTVPISKCAYSFTA